jgi:pimeloyl-ACP methyl ester carboxylesterase
VRHTQLPSVMRSLPRVTNQFGWVFAVALLGMLQTLPARSQSFPSLAVNPDATILDDNPNDVPLAAGEPCSSRSDFQFNPVLPTGFLTNDFRVAPLLTAGGLPVLDTSDTGQTLSSSEEIGGGPEYNGRLAQPLKSEAQELDPLHILYDAVLMSLGRYPNPSGGNYAADAQMASFMAELAVTGRHLFEKFQALQFNDITSSLTIARSGLVLNRSTHTFNSVITLTNPGAAIAAGDPFVLVITNLTNPGILVNRSGQDSAGHPYLVLSANALAQGQNIAQVLEFSALPGPTTLAVGRMTNPPQDASLLDFIASIDPATNQFCLSSAPACQNAIHSVLDTAYNTLWAIRANDASWRAFRSQQGWFAVSGEDDTPHRPVNVSTSPYPQYDIKFDVPAADGTPLHMTTRYVVASGHRYLGPAPDFLPGLLNQPPVLPVGNPAPRIVPFDLPSIPADGKIIIYIHGGGSRAEEDTSVANYIQYEALAQVVSTNYTVISFDMPNSAYGESFDAMQVVQNSPGIGFYPPGYVPAKLDILNFEEQYIINFIEALDQQIGNVKNRIVAVVGGSLGADMGLLLSSRNDAAHQYLNTIVAWSATSLAPSTTGLPFGQAVFNADLADNQLQPQVTSAESTSSRHDFFHALYFQDLIDFPPNSPLSIEYGPPQPVQWYRSSDWQPCKTSMIAQSRFDRYEVYSTFLRHWSPALNLELIYLAFPDAFGQGPTLPGASALNFTFPSPSVNSRLLLMSGDNDNYFPPYIYYNTQVMSAALTGGLGLVIQGSNASQQAFGQAEFWQNTGHSFHDERPQALAREIVHFIAFPNAGTSYLTVGESRFGAPAWSVQGIVTTKVNAPSDFPFSYLSPLVAEEKQMNCNCYLDGGKWAIIGPDAPRSGFFTGQCAFVGVLNPNSIWRDGRFADCANFTQ